MTPMLFPMPMPGAFPRDVDIPDVDQAELAQASNQVDELAAQDFESTQLAATKIARQLHLLRQIDSLVVVLAAYQFVKYCHLALLVPLVAHVAFNMAFNVAVYEKSETANSIYEFMNTVYNDNEHSGRQRLEWFLKCTLLALYFKTLAVLVYHVCFVVFWLWPITSAGKLPQLANGSWWVVSFIGEIHEIADFKSLSWISKLGHLGLFGLLFTDFAILFLQLMQYQAFYMQSALNPLHKVQNELEVLRASGDFRTLSALDPDSSVALVFNVYQTFSSAAFVARDPS